MLVLLTSLLAFPVPLINRYLIDKVILGKQFSLLLGTVLLLAGIKAAGILFNLLQQYFFTRFEQEVLFEIQQTLFDRTLRLPKSFFDARETGYLMSRLLGDVNAAGIHDFIASLPEDYHALVGERGVNFSEGQKQRLAIARALVKNLDIVILGEPTSALNAQTEESIFASLPKMLLGKTLFIIAHRLSTIHQAERILCFNDKGLVGAGSHGELQEKCEYYQLLLRSQMAAQV